MEGIAFHRIHEELLNGNFAGDVLFVQDSGVTLIPKP
jgi:hypothetical protein